MGTTYWPKDDGSGDTEIRFAPMVMLGMGGTPSVNAVDDGWSKWFEPYYRGWINPNIGQKAGVMMHVVKPSLFTNSTRPSDATNPNDAGYDFSVMDDILDMSLFDRDEVVLGWLWRLETSSGSGWPDWWPDDWTVTPPNETRSVPNWGNTACLQFMKDLMTAIGTKYNNNTNLYFWGFSEQNGVPQEQNPQQVEFVEHGIEQLSKCLCLVMQSPDIYIQVVHHPHIGKISSGPNAFRAGCGNGGNFPTYDCGDPNWGYMQTYSSVIQNPPGGYRRCSALSQESNEFRIIQSTIEPIDSPWGANTLFPLASERFVNSNISPAVVVWYCSYIPRASGADANAGLGWSGGDDPGGVVPCNILVHGTEGLRMTGIEPKEYDRAYRLFGANGTQAALWPPIGFSAGGSPPSVLPFIADADDESFYDGETGVAIRGTFDATQGTGHVRIYPNNTATGATYAAQTVTAWTATQITVTINQGALGSGGHYLFVTHDNGDISGAYEIFFQSSTTQPIIQTLSDNSVTHGQTGVVVTGTDFGAVRNNGFVEINEADDGSGLSTLQTATSWSDTSITFSINAGGHALGASYYLLVHDGSNAISNAVVITLETTTATGPIVTDVSDGDIYNGENALPITGTGFGAVRGTGFVFLSDASDGSGVSVPQQVLTWSDTSITLNVVLGGLPDLADAYLIVVTNTGEQSNGYPVLVRANVGPNILITSADPAEVTDALEGCYLNGDGFGFAAGGRIEVTPRGNFSVVAQQVAISWTDDRVKYNFLRSGLSAGELDVYVINSSGYRSNAFPLTLLSATGTPIISALSDDGLVHEQPDIIISGANFGAGQGAGRVVVWETSALGKGAVQSIQSWSNSSITFTVNLLDLVFETRAGYLTVLNDDGLRSEVYSIQIESLFETMTLDNSQLGYTDSAGWVDV